MACPSRQTTTKTRIIAHNQQVVRVDFEVRHAMAVDDEKRLLAWLNHEILQCGACILSDYAKGVVSPQLAEDVIRIARHAGKPVVVDPKGADYAKYRGATVVKPNIHEAERLTKQEITDEASLLEVETRCNDGWLGGSYHSRRPRDVPVPNGTGAVHIPTVAHNVFDVTGGDTVVSTLAVLLAAARDACPSDTSGVLWPRASSSERWGRRRLRSGRIEELLVDLAAVLETARRTRCKHRG